MTSAAVDSKARGTIDLTTATQNMRKRFSTLSCLILTAPDRLTWTPNRQASYLLMLTGGWCFVAFALGTGDLLASVDNGGQRTCSSSRGWLDTPSLVKSTRCRMSFSVGVLKERLPFCAHKRGPAWRGRCASGQGLSKCPS